LATCVAAIVMCVTNVGLASVIGLEKPPHAVENYDVAYFKDSAQGPPTFLETGLMKNVFDDPDWVPGTQETIIRMGNEFVPDMRKEIWLLVDYATLDIDRVVDIFVRDPAGSIYSPTIEKDDIGRQIMFYWILPDQPPWEDIIFPNDDYLTLEGEVFQWNFATICTPEPATLTLLCVGGLAMLKRRRR